MGADITLCKNGEKLWYWRDPYNPGNVAWVLGLSYWNCEEGIEAHRKFLLRLCDITDKQILQYVERKAYDSSPPNEEILREYRDDIALHRQDILDADEIFWSV